MECTNGAAIQTISERWSGKNGYINFIADMKPRPSSDHSLHRKDGNGTYAPDNCESLFRRLRAQVPKTPRLFMPLPLTGSDGSLQSSDKAVAPPWAKRRLWVQGESGMGKTALFRNITEAHFRDHETAFAAVASSI